MAASAVGLLCLLIAPSQANALPPNFTETTALSGLTAPTVVRFASDGRVLVAEKSGLVQLFSGLGDPTPETVVDLRTNVYDFADHGLLGMALDPGFAANNRIYVGYTHDAPVGDTAPVWDDDCPNPEEEGCPVSVRVSRITLNIGDPTPPEDWVIEDWCQQYSSHSIGSLEFGSDGALYASGGEGASFQFADWGQNGNPCGDPPNQGGALRSQDLRTSGDPVGLGGTVIRVDPATGAGLPSNPNGGSSNANTRRIIAQGLRNPFRFAISPGNELWIGDVGWNTWEELNRMPRNPPSVVNFGWPCYEGSERQEDYDDADLSICEDLYTDAVNPATGPAFAYQHDTPVIPGESCPTFASSLAGVDFYEGGPFPAAYEDALFFADFTRDCIWVIRAGAGGSPDPATLSTFHTTASNLTFLQTGPGGALYYTDIIGGRVQRIGYANQPPTAAATASPASGREPLTVAFDGTQSGDLEGPLAYDWDLDGDGQYDDSTAPAPQRTYDAGAVTIGLRVVDDEGVAATATVPVNVAARQDPPLRLFKLRLFIPESVDQLIKRGGRAKLKCNLDCRVTMKLVAKGGRAKAIGIDGTIARQVKSLDANDPTEVVAKLRKRAVRRLEKSGRDRAPRVVPKFKARAR